MCRTITRSTSTTKTHYSNSSRSTCGLVRHRILRPHTLTRVPLAIAIAPAPPFRATPATNTCCCRRVCPILSLRSSRLLIVVGTLIVFGAAGLGRECGLARIVLPRWALPLRASVLALSEKKKGHGAFCRAVEDVAGRHTGRRVRSTSRRIRRERDTGVTSAPSAAR